MHHHRIIHQDINPSNIFVVGSGDEGTALVVKIGDYGLAMSTAEQNAYDGPYRYGGTSNYMAPEVLLWKPDYNTRADTWSLGCVMAELLTGEVLFETAEADKVTVLLYKIFHLLGVPGKKAYKEFKSPFYTNEVDLWRREQQQRARHRSRLREMFPEKTLSKEGFEVLSGLLTCVPSKRLDAAAALRLPWFANTDNHAPAPAPAPGVAAVSKMGGAAASIWAMASYSWQVALSCFDRALRSVKLAPKEVYKS
jgi:cell division cycle 2-like protein